MGYCTLYGDMTGGFAVIKDIAKTLVYRLSRWRNTVSYAIPERIITRPRRRSSRGGSIRMVCHLMKSSMLSLRRPWRTNFLRGEIIARGYATKRPRGAPAANQRVQAASGAGGDSRHPARIRQEVGYPITNRYRDSY